MLPPEDQLLAQWTEAQLWDAWHSSRDKLTIAVGVQERLWRVQQRQLYLDELELRNPRAFKRWLRQSTIFDAHAHRRLGPEL